jgi:hypothetical protein
MCGYFFLFTNIRGKNQNASLLSQEIDTYAESRSLREKSDKAVEEQREQIEKVDSYFLHKSEVVPFIEMIEDAGRKSGVQVLISNVGVEGAVGIASDGTGGAGAGAGSGAGEVATAEKKDQTLTLRLDAKGSWSNVTRFVSYVENLPYKVSIERVDLNRSSSVAQFFATSEDKKSSLGTPSWNVAVDMNVLTLQ